MAVVETISQYWLRIQRSLFPWLSEIMDSNTKVTAITQIFLNHVTAVVQVNCHLVNPMILNQVLVHCRRGVPAIGKSTFGVASVKGYILVPLPAARIIAPISLMIDSSL